MGNPTWVPRVVVRAAHFEQLREHGGLQGIRDPNGLEAALARPINKHTYDAAADEADLAASYAFGIVRGHCFVDGNKRVGLAVALIFLELNCFELSYEVTDDEVADIILETAEGRMGEPELAEWFRERLVRVAV